MKLYHKFSFKMVVSVLLLSMVPLVVTMVLSYNITKYVVTDKINDINVAIVEGYKSGIKERIESAVSSLKAAALSDDVIEMDVKGIGHSLSDLVDTNSIISQVYLMDKSGMQIYKSSGELGDRSERAYFQTAISGEANFSDVIISGSTGIPIIVYAIPVYEGGDVVGVLGASIDLTFVESLVTAHADEDGSYGFVVDRNGVILAHPNHALMEERVNVAYLKPVEDVMAGIKDSSEYTYEGVTKLASYEPLELTQWGIVYQRPIEVAYASISNILKIFVLITLFTVVVVAIITLIFSSGVSRPLKEIEKRMKDASEGKLNVQINHKLLERKDEFGYLARDFTDMIKALRGLLGESVQLSNQVSSVAVKLASTSDQTKALSNEITNAVDEIAHGASEQALESEKGVEVTSKFSVKFVDLAERSKSMHNNVDLVIEVNETGIEKVRALDEASDKSVIMTKRVETSIKELDEKSASISEILETITSIAEQTNLLALNASIEAARAGEHGRGFAVVADEIRKLAEGSKDATDAIGTIISSIQSEIQKSVESMEEVSSATEFQSDSVLAVTEAFKNIDKSIKQISENIRDIDSSVNELNDENVLVVDAISNISAVSEETAAAAQQVAASVEQQYSSIEEVAEESAELQELAVSLKEEIEKFEL